jgi:hypothetical protein
MTFNNSVLMIVKQTPGIEYNNLLSKISQRYKNPASAKSALARALKDMGSFGLIKREGTRVFVTDKGLASMSIEMKDKLVLRLNEEMKRPLGSLNDIVRLLIVLSQRGGQDKDLLTNAKENASFSIEDIEELRRKIRAERKHLKQMSLLLEQQAIKLRELDFNDTAKIPFDEQVASKIGVFCKGQKIIVETKDNDILSKIPEHWKKQGIISVEGDNIPLLTQLLASMLSIKATLYLPGIKFILMAGNATLFGSHKAIKAFVDMKVADEVKSQLNEAKNQESEAK